MNSSFEVAAARFYELLIVLFALLVYCIILECPVRFSRNLSLLCLGIVSASRLPFSSLLYPLFEKSYFH